MRKHFERKPKINSLFSGWGHLLIVKFGVCGGNFGLDKSPKGALYHYITVEILIALH